MRLAHVDLTAKGFPFHGLQDWAKPSHVDFVLSTQRAARPGGHPSDEITFFKPSMNRSAYRIAWSL